MFIVVPKAVAIAINGAPYTFIDCICYVMNTHPSFNKTGLGICMADRIEKDLEGAVEGSVVQIGNDEGKVLQAAFESPAEGWCPTLEKDGKTLIIPGRMFLPYFKAVAGATSKRPDVSKSASPASGPSSA